MAAGNLGREGLDTNHVYIKLESQPALALVDLQMEGVDLIS